MCTIISPQHSTQRGQVDTYPSWSRNLRAGTRTQMHAHTHRYRHTHIHMNMHLYTRISVLTHVGFPSPPSTHRGRGDTYRKLVKPLKTPAGTLVSWLWDSKRYLWAWQTQVETCICTLSCFAPTSPPEQPLLRCQRLALDKETNRCGQTNGCR